MELVSSEFPDINVMHEDLIVSKLRPELDALELSPALGNARISHLAHDEVLLLVLNDSMHERDGAILLLRKEYFH